MPADIEDNNTISARLSNLPVTEHAILLNRFKFLDLVQRVAAADVAEMVHAVGLEALSYKGTLERIPLTHAPAATERETTIGKRVVRRGASQRRSEHTVTLDVSGDVPPRRRQRFPTREKELHFVERMSQPQKRRDLLDDMIRKPPRGYQEEETMYTQNRSASIRPQEASNAVPFGSHVCEGTDRRHAYLSDNGDDDNVVIDSSLDRPFPASVPLKVQAGASPHSRNNRQQVQTPQFQAKEQISTVAGATGTPTVGEVNLLHNIDEVNVGVGRYDNTSQVLQPSGALRRPSVETETPLTGHSTGVRLRGPFAPKAKPKAAAEVSRVPLEVIRHASALLAGKKNMPPPSQPLPQGSSPTAPIVGGNMSSEEHGITFPLVTSQSLRMPPSMVPSSKQGDSDVQRGNTSLSATPMTLSGDAIAELASSVERMLQDHQTILDGIVREGAHLTPDFSKESRKGEKGGEQEAVDDVGGGRRRRVAPEAKVKRVLLDSVSVADSARIVQQAHDALEDISDEEDELLLVSRLQRQLGAMDRELATIEQREEEDNSLNGDREDEDKDGYSRATQSQRRRDRRVAIVDSKTISSKEGGEFSACHRRRRRRGEMPRAIVERLRSFQKENHEYIRYSEKQWNTSHVTEQVFAQRLTDALVEDALQEVLEEVGTILDTYIEGLALHELQ